MRMFIMAAFAALMTFATPAMAAQCVPLAAIGAELQAASIPADALFATEDVSFINVYTKELGIGIPDGAQPVGLLLVNLGDRVLVSLVENEGGYCVRYTAVIPRGVHDGAFAIASRQA